MWGAWVWLIRSEKTDRLWDVLDEIVQLNDCDVYTYNPDVDDDPMNEEEGYL